MRRFIAALVFGLVRIIVTIIAASALAIAAAAIRSRIVGDIEDEEPKTFTDREPA